MHAKTSTIIQRTTTACLCLLILPLSGCGENSLPAQAKVASVTPSSTGASLAFASPAITVAPGSTCTLAPTGGKSPYVFTVMNAIGLITAPQGISTNYVAPTAPGAALVQATDSSGVTATVVITVSNSAGGVLSVTPVTTSLTVGSTVTFSPSGGTAPYTYVVTPTSAGTFSGSQFAASATGSAVVTMTDSSGLTATAAVTITAPACTTMTTLASSSYSNSCVECAHTSSTLTCYCYDSSDNIFQTSLNYTQCSSTSSIVNNQGTLTCSGCSATIKGSSTIVGAGD